MNAKGYEPMPLPTAPPPPYDATQPPYNPHTITSLPAFQYQPAPVVNENPVQGSQTPYPVHNYQPQPLVSTTVTENTVFVPLLVGPQPMRTTCPNCRASIQTHTSKESKGIAHLFCLGLFFIGCCLCSCIPYCIESLKEVRHTCPRCKACLGTYRA